MKKYILTLIFALICSLTLNANAVKTEQTIEKQISEVVINIPSKIKVFQSEDNRLHFRIRSKYSYLLDDVYYKYDNKTLQFNSTYNICNIGNDKIVIYLYVPDDNIKYSTYNNDLFVSINKITNKNINETNHENKD